MDASYLDRLVDAYANLLRVERRTDIDKTEIARRVSVRLGRVVPSQTVGRWVSGKVQPREAAERMAFAEVLGTTVGWLFYAEPNAKKPATGAGSGETNETPDALRELGKREAAKKTPRTGRGRRH